MILVDTSVWIDHFHRNDPLLRDLLVLDRVGVHDAVLQELSLGSLARRTQVLGDLSALHRLPSVGHEEFMDFVGDGDLWGRGLSAVDVHLLASCLITPGAELWTRDKRLRKAAEGMRILFEG